MYGAAISFSFGMYDAATSLNCSMYDDVILLDY